MNIREHWGTPPMTHWEDNDMKENARMETTGSDADA